MLKVFCQYSELNIPNLLAVYEDTLMESNRSRFHAEQDFCDYLREDFFRIPGSYYAVWCHEGQYVSVLRMQPYEDGFLITGLQTALQARRKGYGTMLISALCDGNAAVYSHVHRSNHQSLRLHKKCGFTEVLDYGVLLDGTVSYQYVTLCYKKRNTTSE